MGLNKSKIHERKAIEGNRNRENGIKGNEIEGYERKRIGETLDNEMKRYEIRNVRELNVKKKEKKMQVIKI
jgi:hypothetical protein